MEAVVIFDDVRSFYPQNFPNDLLDGIGRKLGIDKRNRGPETYEEYYVVVGAALGCGLAGRKVRAVNNGIV
jgi:hypothetical protein